MVAKYEIQVFFRLVSSENTFLDDFYTLNIDLKVDVLYLWNKSAKILLKQL